MPSRSTRAVGPPGTSWGNPWVDAIVPAQSASSTLNPCACAPQDRDHKCFHQDLAEDAPTARSDGHANGNLARAVCGSRSEQAAQVSAGSEQHDSSEQHDATQETAHRSTDKVTHQTRASQLKSQPVF